MTGKISMRKIREILRLKLELKHSNRQIAVSIGVSISTICECLKRAQKAGLPWPLSADMDDTELEQLLYMPPRNKVIEDYKIDWAHIHSELKRKGVTLQLLWEEYKNQFPQGLGYSRYCSLYKIWQGQLDTCMRQNYKYGEKMFVDYAGMAIPIVIDINTGEVIMAQIFVAILGASNYTYCEATPSQTLPDWISSHVRAFQFFGGITEILTCDNLKSGVTKAHLYEPDLNPSYYDMANYYGIALIPTRVAAPRDKSKVEKAVQMVEYSILAKLRNRTFFNIDELNEAIEPLLEELNRKPFQKLPGSRLSMFETLEKPVLKSLPQIPYTFAEWKKAKLGIDYHVALDNHYYSAPYNFIKKELDVRYTCNTIEIFYKGNRIASHQRSYQKGGFSTILEHMPPAHQHYVKWTPERIINWASKSGKATANLVEKVMAIRKHPLQGFRACLGIIRLGESFGEARLELACQRALAIGGYSYKNVLSILKNKLETVPVSKKEQQTNVTEKQHEHVRGNEYFK